MVKFILQRVVSIKIVKGDHMEIYNLNIFAIIILISLLIVISLTSDTTNIKSRLFRDLIITTVLMNLIEILSWVFDSQAGETYRVLNYFFNFLFTAFNTVAVGLWAFYIDYILFKDYKRLKKKWYYFLPTMIMFALSVINLITPILFVIDSSNVYSRLPLIWISIVMTVGIYIYVLALVIRYASPYNKKVLLGVLIFLSFPIIAAVLQLLFYGLLLIWPATALAVLISYLIFETTSNARDYLTGIFTRERAEEQINRHIFRKRNFSVIMLDINNFKMINDKYGHHFGDQALVFVARNLQKIFGQDSIVSRYGGDEFLVVTDITDPIVINQKKQEFIDSIRTTEDKEMRNLRLSYGVSTCYIPSEYNVERIITEADNKMYQDKETKKNEKI